MIFWYRFLFHFLLLFFYLCTYLFIFIFVFVLSFLLSCLVQLWTILFFLCNVYTEGRLHFLDVELTRGGSDSQNIPHCHDMLLTLVFYGFFFFPYILIFLFNLDSLLVLIHLCWRYSFPFYSTFIIFFYVNNIFQLDIDLEILSWNCKIVRAPLQCYLFHFFLKSHILETNI